MLTLIIAASCVALGVGSGLVYSKRRFNTKINELQNPRFVVLEDDNSLLVEINRYEQLKRNLSKVKTNVENLDIPIPEPLSNWDDADSSLNKLSRFFEKDVEEK